jgi:hypothetical protein
MLCMIETGLCQSMDRDSSWWGLRRLRLATDRPYTSGLLLIVYLAYSLPLAALAWVGTYSVASFVRSSEGP